MRKQIDALRKKRNEHLDAMTKLSDLAANDNRLFTADEQAAFDKDQKEIGDIDGQLKRLEDVERLSMQRATPAVGPLDPPRAQVVPFKAFPGQAFTRMVLAVARTKGNFQAAAEQASRWKDQTPEVEIVLRAIANTGEFPSEVHRAAVAAGTTTNPTWAGPLVYAQNLTSEFIDLLRPATIIGRLPLRPVPFNVSIPRQTGAATAGWVGEGQSKPVSPLAFDRLAIPWAKTAVITVITDELARFSDPSAEQLVRDDLVEAIRGFLDVQFIDPTVAPLANVRPGAITNGTAAQVLVVPSTGSTFPTVQRDITTLLQQMAARNLPMTSMYWIMNPAARILIGSLRTAQDLMAFPEISQMRLAGFPIIESNHVATDGAGLTNLILLDASHIFHASDPTIDVTASNEASLRMDTAPTTPPAADTSPLVSLWQQNMLGIKAEQYQYWMRRRDAVVGMITGFDTTV